MLIRASSDRELAPPTADTDNGMLWYQTIPPPCKAACLSASLLPKYMILAGFTPFSSSNPATSSRTRTLFAQQQSWIAYLR